MIRLDPDPPEPGSWLCKDATTILRSRIQPTQMCALFSGLEVKVKGDLEVATAGLMGPVPAKAEKARGRCARVLGMCSFMISGSG